MPPTIAPTMASASPIIHSANTALIRNPITLKTAVAAQMPI